MYQLDINHFKINTDRYIKNLINPLEKLLTQVYRDGVMTSLKSEVAYNYSLSLAKANINTKGMFDLTSRSLSVILL